MLKCARVYVRNSVPGNFLFCQRRARNMRRLSTRTGFRSFSSVPWKLGQENFTKSFSHLQKDAISKKKGQFVHLPQLYDERELAKALRTEDCASFLLTEERLALWEEMNKASGSYSERLRLDGTCLSGPNGVGKSSVLHMLASVAHEQLDCALYCKFLCSVSTTKDKPLISL